MKVIRFTSKENIPASHENPKNPGVMKRALLELGDVKKGQIQMLNWATLLPHKSFVLHSHKDMQEVFLMISGSVVAHVGGVEVILGLGDILVVDPGEAHDMYNPSAVSATYLAMGIVGQ